MRSVWANIAVLLLIILLLPIIIIMIGPLLALAALRGRQPAGPITLNTKRYGIAGRLGALMLGLAIWLFIWSGLAWLILSNVSATSSIAEAIIVTPPLLVPNTATPTIATVDKPFDADVLTNASDTTLTPQITAPPSLTISPSPLATVSPTPWPSPTATPSANPSPTVTPLPTPTARTFPLPTVTQSQNGNTESPWSNPQASAMPTATPLALTIADRQTVLRAINRGNTLLQEAIVDPSEENLRELQTIWQAEAFRKARDFATESNSRYAVPFQTQFEYLTPPFISESSTT